MSRGLQNWTFKNIVKFLEENGFQHTHARGSHFYYLGHYGGRPRQTHVQYHGNSSIHPKTLKTIIRQSGIPQQKWIEWKEGN